MSGPIGPVTLALLAGQAKKTEEPDLPVHDPIGDPPVPEKTDSPPPFPGAPWYVLEANGWPLWCTLPESDDEDTEFGSARAQCLADKNDRDILTVALPLVKETSCYLVARRPGMVGKDKASQIWIEKQHVLWERTSHYIATESVIEVTVPVWRVIKEKWGIGL